MNLQIDTIKTKGLSTVKQYQAWLTEKRLATTLEPVIIARPAGGDYKIQQGFKHDGGSIPRWLLTITVFVLYIVQMPFGTLLVAGLLIGLCVERFGVFLPAFVVHDYAIRHRYMSLSDGNIETVTSAHHANQIMRNVALNESGMVVLSWVLFFAVTPFAWIIWRTNSTTLK